MNTLLEQIKMQDAAAFTHGGKFHADDVFSSALLLYFNPEITITRGNKVPEDFKGIVFDMETGLFRIDNEFEKEVRLVGHGNKYAMVRKALQRNGILASRRVESDFYIETGDMTTSGYIIHPVAGRTIKVDTIEELLEQVTAILASV